MPRRGTFAERRIRLAGVLDGSRAMEVAHRLRDQGDAALTLDFSAVQGFDAFGIDVLLRELSAPRRGTARVRCCGVPPCLAELMRQAGIPVVPSPRHPRWEP